MSFYKVLNVTYGPGFYMKLVYSWSHHDNFSKSIQCLVKRKILMKVKHFPNSTSSALLKLKVEFIFINKSWTLNSAFWYTTNAEWKIIFQFSQQCLNFWERMLPKSSRVFFILFTLTSVVSPGKMDCMGEIEAHFSHLHFV